MPADPIARKPPATPLHGLLRAIFGEFDWHAPSWLPDLAAHVRSTAQRAADFSRRKPRVAVAIAVGVLLALVAAHFAWRWYQSRPKPVEVAFTVMAPERTCYECEPPGAPNPLHRAVRKLRGIACAGGQGHRPRRRCREHDARSSRASGIGMTIARCASSPREDWPIGARIPRAPGEAGGWSLRTCA